MIDWSILRSNGPVDIAGNFARGYATTRKIIDDAQERSALAAYAAHPGDPRARAMLYRVNPAAAARLEEIDMKRSDFEREAEARSALSGWMTGASGIPSPKGLTGTAQTSALGMPEQPVAPQAAPAMASPAIDPLAPLPEASSEDPITITAKRPEQPNDGMIRQPPMSDDWKRYVENDPQGAMKTLLDRADLGEKQAKALAGQMDFIGRLAAGVTDQASYEQAKATAQAQGFDTSHLPPEYGPQVVANMQAQAMSAKDYLKQKWDITDDEIDNAEQHRHNAANEDNTRRGQDMTDSRGRRGQDIDHEDRVRGQDIGSADRRRGQDLSSEDRKRGQDLRGKGGRGGGHTAVIVNPKTGQRMKLENGKWVPA